MITFLAALSLLGQLTSNINAINCDVEANSEKAQLVAKSALYGRANSADTFELFIKVPVDDEEMARLAASQNEDGSFSDINYEDTKRSGWDPLQHALRVERLAIRYARLGDEKALGMARKGLVWWGVNMPVCRNWWYNEIGIPRQFANAALLMLERLSEEEIAYASKILDKVSIKRTGQNRVWECGSVLINGILKKDEETVRMAAAEIQKELNVTDDVEGLQKDWSFHQHGPQLQFGNYGLSYAVTQCWWARAFKNTELELPAEKLDVLRKYLENGLTRLVWDGNFDHNASARQIFKDNQISKAICVEYAAKNMGVSMDCRPWGAYYPLSDFGLYRGRSWYASIRMQSNRTCGFECTNRENMRGWFSADGALMIRRNGNEYLNISPVWNWKHIPGTTSWDDGQTQPLNTPNNGSMDPKHPYNPTDLVGGFAKGRRMTAWMEINRDGLKARKAWFFFPGGVVCLGSGITMDKLIVNEKWQFQPKEDVSVVTTIEQNLLKGEVGQGDNWYRHNRTSYVMLDGKKAVMAPKEHKGTWGDVAPFYEMSDSTSADMFEIYLDHGFKPENASYAYVILPDDGTKANAGEKAARFARRRIKIIENTPERMVVRIGLRRYEVDWNKLSQDADADSSR